MVDTAKLREAIARHFSAQELTNFCFDYFPDIYDELTPGMTKSQQIQLLLDAARHGRMENLLAALEKERPTLLERGQFVIVGSEQPLPTISLVRSRTERSPRRVFISYARQDKNFVYRLAGDLKKHGWQVWIAPDSIRPGEKWVDAINRGLTECGVFLLVVTRAALESEWVRSETNAAIELEHKNEIRFVPLQVEAVTTPPLWRSYQWIRFNINYKKEELRLLLETLDEKSGDVLGKSITRGSHQQRARNPSRERVTVQKSQRAHRYSDKRLTTVESKEKALALYERLVLALREEKWAEVIEIGLRIQEYDLNYLNTVESMFHARKQLQALRKQAEISAINLVLFVILALFSIGLFLMSYYFFGLLVSAYDVFYLLGFVSSCITFVFCALICCAWLEDTLTRTNINKASIGQLNKELGIALTFAHRIVEYRRTEGYLRSVQHAKAIPNLNDKTRALLDSKGKVCDFVHFNFEKYVSTVIRNLQRIIKWLLKS